MVHAGAITDQGDASHCEKNQRKSPACEGFREQGGNTTEQTDQRVGTYSGNTLSRLALPRYPATLYADQHAQQQCYGQARKHRMLVQNIIGNSIHGVAYRWVNIAYSVAGESETSKLTPTKRTG